MKYSDILQSSPYEKANGNSPCFPVQKNRPLSAEETTDTPLSQPNQPTPFQPVPIQPFPYQPFPVQPIQPMPVTPVTPITPPTQEGPPVMSIDYIPGYLRANIGKLVRAEFVVGTSQYLDKTGILTEVGVNYFVLQETTTRTLVMCDLYSVRFVTILNP